MKYKPEPKQKGYLSGGGRCEPNIVGWEVEIEEDEYYTFDNQDDAMMFCLMLEIKDEIQTPRSVNTI